jgi:hypothetical protein
VLILMQQPNITRKVGGETTPLVRSLRLGHLCNLTASRLSQMGVATAGRSITPMLTTSH